MSDREDEPRRTIERDRLASRMLAAMTAENMAKVRFYEEGIKEQLRRRERLLAERARYLEEIERVREDTRRLKAETERYKAMLGAAMADINRWIGGGRKRKRAGERSGGGRKRKRAGERSGGPASASATG